MGCHEQKRQWLREAQAYKGKNKKFDYELGTFEKPIDVGSLSPMVKKEVLTSLVPKGDFMKAWGRDPLSRKRSCTGAVRNG